LFVRKRGASQKNIGKHCFRPTTELQSNEQYVFRKDDLLAINKPCELAAREHYVENIKCDN